MLVQLQCQRRAFIEHPVQSAIALALQHPLAGGQVQARQQAADFRAVMGIGLVHMLTR
ncbi:hypothetical protein D3C84_1033490 [compost metagenome]